jgi:AcrR family transcriptional regulator
MNSVSTRRAATRDSILDAAVRLFAQRGAATTLENVADEAGVTRQTVYVHFGSRTALLIAMVEHMDARGSLSGYLDRVFGAPSALDALDEVVVLHAEYHPEIHHVARLFLAERHHDEAIRAAWDERMDSRRNLYRTVVEWLERDRLLAPAWDLETATDVVWSLTSWQVWEQLVVDRGWSKDDYRQHLRTMLRRTLVLAGLP